MASRSCFVASLFFVAKAFTTFPKALMTSSANKTLFKVPLDKQHVPVIVDGRQVAVKTAYYGQIFVGAPSPQKFTVVFDTGSGHLILPSIECTDASCKLHERYNQAASQTSSPIDHEGREMEADLDFVDRDMVSVHYGTGEILGDFVRETVCIGTPSAVAIDTSSKTPANCARLRVITALEMTEEPFSAFTFDGVLGLGLPPLAVDPEFHFFRQLSMGMQIAPIFSVFLSRSDDVQSEIAFGGHDPKRMVGGPDAIKFVPVERPQDGHWRVKIQSVRVGSTPLPLCDNGACTAIVDTGTSLLGVPSEVGEDFFELTMRTLSDYIASPSDDAARTQVPESEWPDCRQVPGPPITFNMGDFEIALQAEDYSRPSPMDVEDLADNNSNVTHTICRASFLPVNMSGLGERVFIWGEPILRKYYTSFDLEGLRIGFVPAEHPSPEERPTDEPARGQVASPGFIEV